jgi:O-antigen/teichoic acid export membrane protein
MIIARSLSKAQMGTWALFLVITTTYEMSKNALLKSAHIKFMSSSDDVLLKKKITSSSFFINSVLALFFILFILFFGNVFSSWLNAGKELSYILYIYIPGIIFLIFFTHYEAVQQSYFDFKGQFYGQVVKQFIFFILVFVFYSNGKQLDLNLLTIFYCTSIFFGTLTLFFLSRQYISMLILPSKEWSKKIIGYGGYILGSNIFSTVFSSFDQLIVSKFLNPISVSFYSTAGKISTFVDIPSYAAAEILFPKLAKASNDSQVHAFNTMFEKSISVLYSICIPFVTVALFMPKTLIRWVAGEMYTDAAPILQVYLVISILGIVQHQSANALNSLGKSKLCFTLNVLGLIIKFMVVSICLILYGLMGAAIGGLITAFINFFVWYLFIKRHIDISWSLILKNLVDNYIFFYNSVYQIMGKPRSNH